MQSVFKVDLASKSQSDDGQRPFYARKAHTKSRGGCRACKQRRVKCDEAKPRCDKCVRKDIRCTYDPPTAGKSPIPESSADAQIITIGSPNAEMHNLSVAALQQQIDSLLRGSCPFPPTSLVSKPMRDLQHFQSVTAHTLGFSESEKVLSSIVSQAVWKHIYLTHMVLAVSNAHLKRLYPESTHPELFRQTSFIEASHWQVGLQLYRGELDRIRTSKPPSNDTVDAILATTFLSTVFAFAVDDEVPPDTFTSNDEAALTNAINPLVSTSGFRALSSVLPELDTASAWSRVLRSSDDDQRTFTSDAPGIEGLPAAFVELCKLTPDSTAEKNVYHKLLRRITPLLRLKAGREHLPKFFAFVGRVWPDIKTHVLNKDAKCLLFIAWWLALLRHLDLWWISVRARTECLAIVNYLSALNDASIQPFLAFPASFGSADYDWIWRPLERKQRDTPTDDQVMIDPEHLYWTSLTARVLFSDPHVSDPDDKK